MLIHTEVPAELAGRGLASRLARTALNLARDRGVKVVVRCPFVTEYIARHPEYHDLVRERSVPKSPLSSSVGLRRRGETCASCARIPATRRSARGRSIPCRRASTRAARNE